MATMHHLSVITNNCYKPPVNPENGLSASLNERKGLGFTSSRYDRDSEGESDQENMHVVNVDNVNNSAVNGNHSMLGNSLNLFNQTDSYMGNVTADLAGLDDSEFYKRLTDLKNEHKKTLQLCEQMYQEKVGHAYSSNQTTPHSKAKNLSMNRSRDFDSDQDDVSYLKNTSQMQKSTEDLARSLDVTKSSDVKLDASFGKPPKPPTSQNRPASSKSALRKSLEEPRSARSAWTDRSDGEGRFWKAMSGYSSEADYSGDETHRNSYDVRDYVGSVGSGDDLNHSARHGAVSHIEGMWDNFSIDDYAPRRSRAKQRSNSMSKLSRSSSMDKKSDRALSVTSTDWKHRVTVPQPFKMTVRESFKERARSKTLEEFEQNRREKEKLEEEECQKKFKATPVPAHVYMPLYDEIMEQKEARRREMHEACVELTKSIEKPFKFVKREEERKKQHRSSASSRAIAEMSKGKKKSFKAKPFPEHLFNTSTEDKMLEEEEYRKIRVQMRAEEMLRKSQLPPNMAAKGKDYTEGRYRSKSHAKKAKKLGFTDDYNFKPKINDDVPDFDELHREFHKEMAQRKTAREATVCKPFNLRTEKVVHKKHKKYEDILQEEATLRENRWPYQSLRGGTLSSTLGNSTLSRSLDSIPTKMTTSAHLRSTASKKKMEDAMEKELKEQEEERKRRLKEKQLRKVVAEKAAANDNTPTLKETNQLKIQEYKAAERARLQEYRRQLNEMKERVETRPLLFERTSQENASKAAEKRYKDTLKRAGLDEDFIAKKSSTGPSTTRRYDDDDAASDNSYSYASVSKKQSRSESKKYSDDFDDGLSDGDRTPEGSDIGEDLPADD